ncbi:pilus assembly protein PilP [Litoribrevibacter albus]|uniref:Type 4 fimbrial biogenesis protein PilP n=1 Tax=Litoribrevibacter albus TaxID=1473156 RepID=A0AA37SCK0_9GAMM|nr:pilus assembly protein PilP [Litoribrevibacter albus]GLQ33465.1 type 4 fimbrial biogenesis protein PilP [Litoribrevibacter albus]
MLLKCLSRFLLLILVTLSLVGCYGQKGLSDIKAYMAEIRSKPHGRIEPLPEFHAYEAFTYKASELRAPFEKPVVVDVVETKVKENVNLFPDFDRTKEYLERFPITTLSMVGTLSKEKGFLWALVSDENGDVHRVKTGNYLGQNHGQIVEVNELGLQVLEIIPDGDGGWVQRPRAIQIEGLEE